MIFIKTNKSALTNRKRVHRRQKLGTAFSRDANINVKMKQPLALIILFSLCSCMLTDTRQVKTDLYGKVKQIIETTEQAVLENEDYRTMTIDNMPKVKKIKSYNRDGELVAMTLLLQDQLMTRVDIRYDSKGRMKSQRHYNQNGKLTTTFERTSDSTTVTRDARGIVTTESTEREISPQIKRVVSLNSQQERLTITKVTRDDRNWITQIEETTILRGDTLMNGTEYYNYIETDIKKNWTKCFISNSTDFDSVQVKIRTIEYY